MNEKYNFVKFDVKQFSSGEYEVKIAECIHGDTAVIHWNWFDKSQRDLMLLLMKIGAIKKQYGILPIIIYAPYLPYSRQDRVFEAGQDIAIETLIKAICDRYDDVKIETMALHCRDFPNVHNFLYALELKSPEIFYVVHPDFNASNHFENKNWYNADIFTKTRTSNGIELSIDGGYHGGLHKNIPYIICDDICAGGRTFIECANKLHQKYGNDITIELMVYHAFLDHGLDALKEAGISKIYIINPDSYEYICNLYPNDLTYFEFKEISNV